MAHAPDTITQRPLPDWFDEAKFGIFIHWGIFSVPAFAPKTYDIVELLKGHFDTMMAELPYVEWYQQAYGLKDSPTRKWHDETYGPDVTYEKDFRAEFENNLEHFDAKAWAKAFKMAGARYVVLVTKHHDGYTLWPSAHDNPNRPGWHAPRDLVGELADAVRAEGMRFGTYYSGGWDWTFTNLQFRTPVDMFASSPTSKKYNAYAEAHFRELIDRYEPCVLWNDICYPTANGLFELIEDYYKAVPDGIVNDRWQQAGWLNALFRPKPMRMIGNVIGKQMLKKFDGTFVGPPLDFADFRTPEFSRFDDIQDSKWEATRGMGHGFAHNRTETDADMISPRTLIQDFVDGVSKNGNLLLNVGPDGMGQIPDVQMSRLQAFGEWMDINGEAIYGTRPWVRPSADSAEGHTVRFTRKGDDLYAILFDPGTGGATLDLPVNPDAVNALGCEVRASSDGTKLRLDWTGTLKTAALTLKIAGAA